MKRTTPTRIASGPGYTPGNRMPVAIGKPSSGAIHPAKTTPTSIASGPADRLDNRIRVRADKPFSGRGHAGQARSGPGAALLAFNDGVTCDGETNDLPTSARRAG